MSRYRNWCFTLNNYTNEHLFTIRACVDAGRAKYICFQGEIGENGTRHLQGVACFNDCVTLGGAKLRFTGMQPHLESMRASIAQAIAYTKKEETADPTLPWEEFGIAPSTGQGTRSDFESIRDALKEGQDIETIASDFPGQFIRYHGGITRMAGLFKSPRREPTRVFWFYGPTGSGKSRAAFEEYPDAYVKMPGCKWWDGYAQQDAVIIDDYRRDLCTFSELLRLFDRYPHRVEAKGSSIQFNSKVIIITTPKNPVDTWEGRSEEDIAQLTRRIHEVKRFDIGPFNLC